MRNSVIIFVFILFGCTPKNNDLKMTYLANCGFLYESQSMKVLIDPFGSEFGNFFYLPTSETRDNIVVGADPFSNLDIVLITHIHGDHFNPFTAEQFLLNNEQVKLICPPQVLSQMKDSCVNFNRFETRIISPDISMNTSEIIIENDVSVTAMRLQHGTDRSLVGIEFNDYTEYEKTENFGYLIDFNGKIVFHQGDGCLKINELAITNIEQKVDVAYLSFFDWDSVSYNLLKKVLQPENIVFMHGTIPANERETEEFKSIKSKIIFFEHELEERVF